MSGKLAFEIVSPERLLNDSEAALVVLPGVEGDFGVLANHAPFMSTLRPGVIEIFEEENAAGERLFVKGGLAHVADTGLTILAEETIDLTTVDAADLDKQIETTKEDLAGAADDIARARLEKDLQWMDALQSAIN